MSDEDRDVDIDSDDDDVGSSASATDNPNRSGNADKRAHHNALERKRRDHIKDSFSSLRDSVPSLQGEKVKQCKASRAQILKKAAEYIQVMRRKNTAHQQDIDDLKKQNKVLEEQIRALEKAKASGLTNFSGTSILETKPKSESISSFEGISDSESGSEGDPEGDPDINGDGSGAGTGSSSGSSLAGVAMGQNPAEKGDDPFGPPNKRLKGSSSNNSSESVNLSPKEVPSLASVV